MVIISGRVTVFVQSFVQVDLLVREQEGYIQAYIHAMINIVRTLSLS